MDSETRYLKTLMLEISELMKRCLSEDYSVGLEISCEPVCVGADVNHYAIYMPGERTVYTFTVTDIGARRQMEREGVK